MPLIDDIPVWGDPVSPEALAQIKNALQTGATHLALMADHHVGFGVPIGGVIAYPNRLSPSGVGFDIACGNKAVRLDMKSGEVRQRIQTIMDDVVRKISFGVGRSNADPIDHELFDSDVWKERWAKPLKDRARAQLGTVGSGNHYVDLFEDENQSVWVGVHFGSRGLGHGIASHFMQKCREDGNELAGISWMDADSELGIDYLNGMTLAGVYAYAGRDWVCAQVAKILKAKVLEEVHNHHNFAWREHHDGQDLWVVRKGATPAFPGQKGFVGGSMGDNSVILEGVDAPDSALSLRSTVHGAGRTLSRSAAKGGKGRPGRITKQAMQDWLKRRGVTLRGGDVDEAPQAYKRLEKVLRHHESTIRVLHTLRPLGVAMAGPGVHDPYKD